MQRKLNVPIAKLLIIAITIGLPLSLGAEIMWSGGPADGYTGAPGENTCMLCHEHGPDDGEMAILGLPVCFAAGETYDVTVSLADPGQQRWGFELTAVDDDDNGAGNFTITDAVNTQLSDNNPETARDYVKHTSTGTYNGTMDGPVTWDFQWTAPSDDVGRVTFFAAGNAADGDGTPAGNYIYSVSTETLQASFPIPSLTGTGLTVLAGLIILVAVSVIFRKYLPGHKGNC